MERISAKKLISLILFLVFTIQTVCNKINYSRAITITMSVFGYETPETSFYDDYEMETETLREVYSFYDTNYLPRRLFTDDDRDFYGDNNISHSLLENTTNNGEDDEDTTEQEYAAEDLPELIPSREIQENISEYEYYGLNHITVFMSVYTVEDRIETFDCPLCLENVPYSNGAITNCNHHYCRDCILKYAISCRHKDMTCALCRRDCKNLEVSDIETFHYIRGNIAQQIIHDGHIPAWFCH